ncbi:hypothetical protein PSEUDO8O_70004 [Pseudomonas sp. 8O]|nr:hypothetical protein PSEUDO8O_70004 [Pseudomonas sp. 8O]
MRLNPGAVISAWFGVEPCSDSGKISSTTQPLASQFSLALASSDLRQRSGRPSSCPHSRSPRKPRAPL